MTTTTPPLTEAAFQAQVLELAHLRQWETFHVRAGRTLDSWRTPGSGTMAKGWPDLVLVRPRDGRLLFIELKTDAGKLTEEQRRVIDVLRSVSGIHVDIWRPADWDHIERVLA